MIAEVRLRTFLFFLLQYFSDFLSVYFLALKIRFGPGLGIL